METIRIPSPEQLNDRLSGLDALLTARKWERAAIVFAYTEVGEVGRGRFYKPERPRMHIRTFAEQGYAGLTTNKSVSRYRDAWTSAISQGWAVPVSPGDEVNLPDQPFPAWPYGNDVAAAAEGGGNVTYTDLDIAPPAPRDYPEARGYSRRPLEQRVLDHLEHSGRLLVRLYEAAPESQMTREVRDQLLIRLSELQDRTQEVIRALSEHLAAV